MTLHTYIEGYTWGRLTTCEVSFGEANEYLWVNGSVKTRGDGAWRWDGYETTQSREIKKAFPASELYWFSRGDAGWEVL
jgi:hypothetical protein